MILENLLNNAKTIAVIGASPNRSRPSNRAVRYLLENGFTVIPINPNSKTVEGITAYASILDVPRDTVIDVVNIFRNPRYTLDAVKESVQWAEESKTRPTLWTQIGVSTDEAQQLASDSGLDYVPNRCIMVTHATMV